MMKSKSSVIVLLFSMLVLGVGVVFGQDADVISPKNVSKLKQVWQIREADNYFDEASLAFSPDGKVLAFRDRSGIRLVDVATNKPTTDTLDLTFPARLFFVDDGKTIEAVTTSYLPGISSWDVATGKKLPDVKTTEPIDTSTTAVSPEGSLIGASLYEQKSWQFIDAKTGETVTTVPITGIVSISPDNKTLAVGDNNTKIELWDLTTGKMTMPLESPSGAYGDSVFSPDGKLLAACNINDGIDIWDVESGKVVSSVQYGKCGHGQTFSPDGKLLATGFANMYTYDAAKGGDELFKIEDASNVAFSPDGKFIATISSFSNTVTLWGL